MKSKSLKVKKGVADAVEFFDHCISNPPYQKTITSESGKTVPRDIFPEFQKTGENLSKKCSMIYPSKRWLQYAGNDSKNYGKEKLRDPMLKEIKHWEDSREIFPSVRIMDGIAITHWERANRNGKTLYLNNSLLKRPAPGDNRPIIIEEKLREIVEQVFSKVRESIKECALGRDHYGIESNHMAKNPDSLRLINRGEELPKGFVKIFTIGEGRSPQWHAISEGEIFPRGMDSLGKWKVIISSSHPVRDFEKSLLLLAPGECHGRSRVTLKEFGSRGEAYNFLNYLQTPLMERLFKLSPDGLSQMGIFTPDIGDYSDSNDLFKKDGDLGSSHPYCGLPLGDRLLKFFEINDFS